MTTTRNMASFAVTPPYLDEALNIPAGHRIVGAEWDFAANAVRFYVEGPDLPAVPYGGEVPRITPAINRAVDGDGNEQLYWDWGL